jgi:multidrug efflux pump subunit AcrA (membrane-fusion protein)
MKISTFVVIFFTNISFLCLNLSCTNSKGNKEESQRKTQNTTTTEVQTQFLHLQPFPLQLTTNGIFKAQQQTQLYFKAMGEVERINVANTTLVNAGQVMAVLDNRQASVAILQSQDQVKKAGFTLNTCQSRF